ncbi:DUF6263 family protein [Alienimonas californiensis]|uniref:DUF3108 domain-containing protein n=1 Tax=Alienimonas californiensis TaxID=2527989 RepID=A0A517P5Z4_9PLAN|nr:DUF6263 family protein [Alienimonas californiensis]QDT14799.1 hypothetical protein CA12_08780 [Alienimonas californiensis]
MRSPLAFAALLLAPALPSVAAAQTAAAADVRWEFAAGDTHTYAFTQNSTASITQLGETSEVKNDLGIVLSWEVKSVNPDGSAVVERTVQRVTVKATGGGATPVTFDSAAEGDEARDPATLPARLRVLGSLAGQTFTSTIAADGEVKGVEMPAKVTRAIAAAGEGNQFGEEQVKLLFTDRGYTLPPAGTAVGASWKNEETLALAFGKVTDARTLTLKSADDKAAVVTLNSELKPLDAQADAPMKFDGGTQTGAVVFDVANGRLAAVDSSQKATLSGPGGFKVDLTSASKLRRVGD